MENPSPAIPPTSPTIQPQKSPSDLPVIKPTEEEKPKNKLVPFLVFLFIAALGVAGYFGWQNYQLKLEKEVVNVQPEPSLVVEIDETANWEAYSNKKYGFSFKYPNSWKVEESDTTSFNDNNWLFITLAKEEYYQPIPKGKPHIKISVEESINKDHFSIYKNTTVIDNMTVAGRTAEIRQHNVSSINEYYVLFTTGDKTFQYTSERHSEDSNQLKILNQVLSTFKFMDEEDETAGWETYTNDEYKYSLKYPSGWILKETSLEVTEPPLPVGTKLRYIGIRSPNEDFYLGFGIKKISEENVRLTSRTGVGAGDLAEGEAFKIGEYQMPTQWLMFESKVQDILGEQTAFDKYTAYAEFSYFGTDFETGKNMNLIKTPEYQTIVKILSTFKFLN